MVRTTKTVHVQSGSDLERDGVRCRIEWIGGGSTVEPWPGYDPEFALAGLRAAAGYWSDVDAEALKQYLYRPQEEGSRPLDRP